MAYFNTQSLSVDRSCNGNAAGYFDLRVSMCDFVFNFNGPLSLSFPHLDAVVDQVKEATAESRFDSTQLLSNFPCTHKLQCDPVVRSLRYWRSQTTKKDGQMEVNNDEVRQVLAEHADNGRSVEGRSVGSRARPTMHLGE